MYVVEKKFRKSIQLKYVQKFMKLSMSTKITEVTQKNLIRQTEKNQNFTVFFLFLIPIYQFERVSPGCGGLKTCNEVERLGFEFEKDTLSTINEELKSYLHILFCT